MVMAEYCCFTRHLSQKNTNGSGICLHYRSFFILFTPQFPLVLGNFFCEVHKILFFDQRKCIDFFCETIEIKSSMC